MAKETIATRVAPWMAEELRSWAEEEKVGVSALLRRLVEEAWVVERLPGLEFREDATGRRAALRGGPGVWKVVSVLAPAERDEDVLVKRFEGVLPSHRVRQAARYYDRFPKRVDERIERTASAAETLALLPAWSVPAGGLLADWTVSADAVAVLRDRDVEVVHAAELEGPPGPTAALIDRAGEEGRVLVTADYLSVGTVLQRRGADRLRVAVLDAGLTRADANVVASAIAAWWDAGEADERERWVRPAARA